MGKILKNGKLLIFLFAAPLFVEGNSKYPILFFEGFETAKYDKTTKTKSSNTATTSKRVSPGQLSEHALEIEKPDTTGNYIIAMELPVPTTSRGKWLKLTADMKTKYKGVYAEYYLMVAQLNNGVKLGKNRIFTFDDGITRQSIFGGKYKAPQTMDAWRKTIHHLKLSPQADSIKLSFIVSRGEQILSIDNIKVEETGDKRAPTEAKLVYEKKVNWPYAMLDIDTLLPGAVYDIEVDCIWPNPNSGIIKELSPNAKKSDLRPPSNSNGMGISMVSVDFSGKLGKRIQLEERPNANKRLVFRIVVPEKAVSLRLDFHNDDLIRFNHNQIESQARRWGTVRVYQRNLGEIAADNAYWQYVYRGKPPALKPRQYLSPTKFDLDVLKARLRSRGESEIKVVRNRGGMCLSRNGKLVPPMLMSGIEATSHYAIFNEGAKNGMDIIIARSPYGGPVMHGDWQGTGKYDFSDLDESIYEILLQNPNADVVLSIDQVYAPDWWSEKNKDALARTQDGDFVRCLGTNLYKREFGNFETLEKFRKKFAKNQKHISRGAEWVGFYVPSIASKKFSDTIGEYLTAMRKHIESQPYGKAVVGYRFVWGYDGQWGALRNEYGYSGKSPKYIDYSKPMLDYFRGFLKREYKTSSALRKAWNNNEVTLENAALPDIEARNIDQYKSGDYLLDPTKHRQLIDYRNAVASATSELLLKFCDSIKSAGSKNVLTLAYYPGVSGRAGGGPSGHTNYQMILNSKSFDAAGGPSYEARGIGLGNKANSPLNSLALHGKLHLVEMDHRVFPVARRNYANNLLFDTPRRSLSVLRREYMKQMCFGTGSWTFDMGLGWFNDPLIAEIIGNAKKVFSGVLEIDRSSVARMAMFIGKYPKMVQADGRRGSIPKTLIAGNSAALYQTGVPVDRYDTCDLGIVRDKYKVFYFPCAYGLTPEEVKVIESLKRDGNVLVFGYGAGYVSSDKSIANLEKLTGMKMGVDPKLSLTFKITNTNNTITNGVSGYFGSGGNRGLETGLPKFYVDDPKAVKLGEFINGKGKSGFAIKDFGTWKSVYIGCVGFLNAKLFKNIARYAGLHVYNEDSDVMFFNKSLIAIHASSSGTKIITLPKKACVTSLWDGKYVGEIKTIERDMTLGENALYLIKRVK